MDVARLRQHFACLRDGDWAFLESAGGSRAPDCVGDAVAAYVRNSFVQLGAGYEASSAADAIVARARRVAASHFTSSTETGFPVLGGCTSQLLAMLAGTFTPLLTAGDVLVVSSAGHESNVGPWVRLAARTGARVAWWHPSADGEDTCTVASLKALLGAAGGRARLVAFPLVSNLLGGVADVAAIAALARVAGAVSVCDAVAFAPHRPIEACEWGCDFVALSFYKTYGPHLAALWGSTQAWATVAAGDALPNHFFITQTGHAGTPYYPFELGGVCHESAAALVGLLPYLAALGGTDGSDDHATVRAAFAALPALEAPVCEALRLLLEGEHAKGTIRLLGPRGDATAALRVPTFSFLPLRPGLTPGAVVAACHAARIACRCGHMYAPRLLHQLGVPCDVPAPGQAQALGEGVVRVSAVHYNTVEEVLSLQTALRGVL